MKFLALAALTAPLALALPKPSANRALYFLDSDPNGASIISVKVGNDGKLSDAVRTSTGGKGLIGVSAAGVPNAADPMFVQDALVVKGSTLVTVNAGSDTVSLFHIPANDPWHPVLIGEPVHSGGEVPTTVAYSEKNKLACVANGGPKSGVQCFKISSCGSLEPSGGLMPIPTVQTKIPIAGPPNTVSDIVFNPSETGLFVSIKGDGTHEGWIYAFAVEGGKVSPKPVISKASDLLLDFSISFSDSDSSAVVTDPSHGATVISIGHDLKISGTKSVTIPFQSAICWSVYSQAYSTTFLFDGGHANITAIDPESGATKYTIKGNSKGNGNLDSVVDRDWLYSLNSASTITVIDIKKGTKGGDYCDAGPQVAQVYDLSSLGSRSGFTGLAMYTS